MIKGQAPLMIRINIGGIVQGVGFRPFIYRLAQKHNITGHIFNTVEGVLIEAHGLENNIKTFTDNIPHKKPPAATITEFQVSTHPTTENTPPSTFTIKTSAHTGTRTVLISPDLDICDECKAEMFDSTNRRFLYPFINCTNCGPRYTIIENLPYDRPETSMKDFDLCPSCRHEYENPLNRRFHAQPNACPDCGPSLQLVDNNNIEIDGPPLTKTRKLLENGKILAIKGIGGFHLMVDATNQHAVEMLRHRKGRADKPFAIMVSNLVALSDIAFFNKKEEELLTCPQKPIVLLDKKMPFPLAPSISPGINSIGAMLPYSPIHHLLFHETTYNAIVMTSANLSEEPITIDNNEALCKLSHLADYFLMHDRSILTSNDDSVLRVINNQPHFIRRSRSYAPAPITLDYDAGSTLAVGGALKNCICLTKSKQYFMSQHIGDLQHLESVLHFESTIDHMRHVLMAEPDLIVHDQHPDYPSTRYAKNSTLPSVGVQHHHAHAIGCMAENNLAGPVLAVILDGTGYGVDGTIWGGEILQVEPHCLIRHASFAQIPLPGGDQAVRQPWRIAVGLLHMLYGRDFLNFDLKVLKNRKQDIHTICQMIESAINTPVTSSCGRLFDGVAALIGIRDQITYEGQAAIELEMLASPKSLEPYPFTFNVNQNGLRICSFRKTIDAIINDLNASIPSAEISRRFHETIIESITTAISLISKETKLKQVVLSGGVFQNKLIMTGITASLSKIKLEIFTNKHTPVNDGGLALGQAIAGRAIYNNGTKKNGMDTNLSQQ